MDSFFMEALLQCRFLRTQAPPDTRAPVHRTDVACYHSNLCCPSLSAVPATHTPGTLHCQPCRRASWGALLPTPTQRHARLQAMPDQQLRNDVFVPQRKLDSLSYSSSALLSSGSGENACGVGRTGGTVVTVGNQPIQFESHSDWRLASSSS